MRGGWLSSQLRFSMDVPPKIVPTREIQVEVVPPATKESAASSFERAPIHALSALILVAVDSLWAIFDWLPPIWIVAIPACFVAVFLPTFLIQKHLKKDHTGRALTFAMLLGVLAAIPTPITGTPVGVGLLAWSGLGRLLGKTPRR